MVGGEESDYSVCPRPLLQFLQFLQFMSVRLRQVTSGYVRLRQFTSVYVSLCQFTSVYVSLCTLEGRDVELNNKVSFEI